MLKIIFLQSKKGLQQCATGKNRFRQTGQIQRCQIGMKVLLQQIFCLLNGEILGIAFVDAAV